MHPYVLTCACLFLLACSGAAGEDEPCDCKSPDSTCYQVEKDIGAQPDTQDNRGEPVCDQDSECDDENPCTADRCEIWWCEHNEASAEGLACDDGDECTSGETCDSAGACTPGDPVECDDEDPCTVDSCVAQSGCSHVDAEDGAECDDGDPCTSADNCQAKVCMGTPAPCDDGDPCTVGTCDSATADCNYVGISDVPCDDLDECTVGDQCEQGSCVGGGQKDCSDSNPCTDDLCDAQSGCSHVPNVADCDDLSLCTQTDICEEGACIGSDPLNCEDGNDCTADTCKPETGCVHTPVNMPCDDGNGCTPSDSCVEGACLPGLLMNCDDGNPCTQDLCDPLTGQCAHSPGDASCDDGNLCTSQDGCLDGLCVGTAIECDDLNVCTSDSCQPDLGCINNPVPGPCDDGNVCTVGDICTSGLCNPGAESLSCDDNNPCTTDLCDPAVDGGCTFQPNEYPCIDGNPCTANDFCADGVCKSGPDSACDCETDADCTLIDDDDLCNGKLVCDLESFPKVCVLDPQSIVECDDGDDTSCLQNKCDPSSGQCGLAAVNEGKLCDDQNLCTQSDMCAQGVCAGTPSKCGDENPCTDDSCSPAQGCEFTANQLGCDDENPCTLADTCALGACIGADTMNCDDLSVCTTDSCDPDIGGCVHAANDAPCDDGNLCTVADVCQNKVCGGAAIDCDDLSECTDDTCDEEQGCVNTPNQSPCDDGNICSLKDTCADGVCAGTALLDCDDSNPCTDNACVPDQGGCVYQANNSPCDDGNMCTQDDACSNWTCSGSPANCDDENVCTTDGCAPESGCTHENNFESCEDGNLCTKGEVCAAGVCLPGVVPDGFCEDGNVCTADSCEPASGNCTNAPTDAACDDNSLCTSADLCLEGLCQGAPLDCDDLEVCTADSCDDETGCVHEPVDSPCDDGDACTENDICFQGSCIGGGVACDDKDVCTDDSCDIENGCQYQFNQALCDDGVATTTDDQCNTGSCNGLPDPDEDGIANSGYDHDCSHEETAVCNDNCPEVPNPNQEDWNGNGLGDPCDPCLAEELCNGKDDDCDNDIDEDFPNLGDTCDGEDLDPCTMGTYVCSPDETKTICEESGSIVMLPHAPAAQEFVSGQLAQASFPLTGGTGLNANLLKLLFGATTEGTTYAVFEIPTSVYSYAMNRFVHREAPDLRFYAAVDLNESTLEIFTRSRFQSMARFFGPAQGVHTYEADPDYLRELPLYLAKVLIPWMKLYGYIQGDPQVNFNSVVRSSYSPSVGTPKLFLLAHESRQCCDSNSLGNHNAAEIEFTVSATGLVNAHHYGRSYADNWNQALILRDAVTMAHAQDCCAGDVMELPETADSFLVKLQTIRTFDDAWAAWYYAAVADAVSSDAGLDITAQHPLGKLTNYKLQGLEPTTLADVVVEPAIHDADVQVESSCKVTKIYSAPAGKAFHKLFFRVWTDPTEGDASSHWFYIEGLDSATGGWQRIVESASPPATLYDEFDLFAATGRTFDQVKVYLTSDCQALHNNPGHFELKLWAATRTDGDEVQLVIAGRPQPSDFADSSGDLNLAFSSTKQVELLINGQSVCTGVMADTDADGIPDDGDGSGEAGDTPCPDGQTEDCDDNCQVVSNANQADDDDNGVGDACE